MTAPAGDGPRGDTDPLSYFASAGQSGRLPVDEFAGPRGDTSGLREAIVEALSLAESENRLVWGTHEIADALLAGPLAAHLDLLRWTQAELATTYNRLADAERRATEAEGKWREAEAELRELASAALRSGKH